MKDRLELQKIFEDLLGSRNVYFQPPSNFKMKYPCIRYTLRDLDTRTGNNKPYTLDKSYEVTYIDPDPDSDIPEKLAMMPMTGFMRSYIIDGLNCYVYVVHY